MELYNIVRTSKYLRKIYLSLPVFIRRLYIDIKSKRHDGWRKTEIYTSQIERLRKLRDRHKGETCILLANGPSLKETNWDLLRSSKFPVIGLNRIAMLTGEMGFEPDYLVVIKDLVIEQFPNDILNLSSTSFVDFNSARSNTELRQGKDIFLIGSRLSLEADFSTDLTKGWYRGFTVTYAALQAIFYMGFHKVIIIGLDHNFVTPGNARRNVVSEGGDPNHFHPDYFGKGIKWALPDLLGSEKYYKVAKDAFEKDSRSIIDCTKGGKCQIFNKGNLLEELGAKF